jgi:hypothetical protein
MVVVAVVVAVAPMWHALGHFLNQTLFAGTAYYRVQGYWLEYRLPYRSRRGHRPPYVCGCYCHTSVGTYSYVTGDRSGTVLRHAGVNTQRNGETSRALFFNSNCDPGTVGP